MRLNGRSRAGRVKGRARPLAPANGPARAFPGASASGRPGPPPPAPARQARQGPARPGARRKASASRPGVGPGKQKARPPGKASGPKEGARLLSAGAGVIREGYRARETFTSAPIA